MSTEQQACNLEGCASGVAGQHAHERVVWADEASVTQWLGRLAEGDPSAAEKIWHRYYERLVRFARQKLASADRRVSDEEDLAQSVFDSFFRAAAEGRYPKLNDRDALWRLLLVITSRKAISLTRRQLAQKRGGGDLRGESALLQPGADDQEAGIDQVLGQEPTPEFAALAREQCERLLDSLGDQQLRRIALLRLEGYTVDEIAAQLDRAPGTIHRKLTLIREKWQEQTAA
jgi:RNA polymerase sigma factor (sigma-70 family)